MDRVDQIAAALGQSGQFALEGQVPNQVANEPSGNQVAASQPAPQAEPPKAQGPGPVPYERFLESRRELKEAKERLAAYEAREAQARSKAPTGAQGQEDEDQPDWLSEILGGSSDKTEPAPRRAPQDDRQSDPVYQAMRQEYAERKLNDTLAKFSHVPEDIMLAGLANGMSAEDVDQVFHVLQARMAPGPSGSQQGQGQGQAPQGKAPPPRPASSAQSGAGTLPPPKKVKMPSDPFERVEFLAKMINDRGQH